MLFNEDGGKRDTFSELGERRRAVHTFNAGDVERIRKVYPVLVVQDFSMTTGFMNRRLKIQFARKLEEYEIKTKVHVRPLSLLTVENLENVLEHLEEIKLTDFLDEYASEKHQPLSTFNNILDDYLKSRGADEKRLCCARCFPVGKKNQHPEANTDGAHSTTTHGGTGASAQGRARRVAIPA